MIQEPTVRESESAVNMARWPDLAKHRRASISEEAREEAFKIIARYEEDLDTVILFNPYHDTAGRFTDKMHASKRFPSNRLVANGKVGDRAAFRVADAASLAYESIGDKPGTVNMYQKQKDFANVLCDGSSGAKGVACSRNASRLYGAYYKGAVHISPKGTKMIERDRKFGEYVIGHEVLHSRKRSDGSQGADLSFKSKGDDSYYNSWARLYLEEGATDLLTRRSLGLNEKYWSAAMTSPVYQKNMASLALLAGKATGWDREASWKLIDEMHYNINDSDYIFDLLSRTVGTPKNGWDGKSYYAAMLKLNRAAQYRGYRDSKWLLKG